MLYFCQCHSTGPQPIQLVPTMQKKLFTLSFQQKFLKIRFTKVAGSRSFLMIQQFFSSPCQVVPGACLSQIVTNSATSNTHKHPKTPTNTHKTPTKSCATTLSWKSGWKPSTRREFWHLRINFSFPSYGNLKVKTNFSNVFLRPCSLIPLMHCS